jgi:ribonucleoside-diphosphate reductase alpha chain
MSMSMTGHKLELSPQALTVLRERYLQKDSETGEIIETPDELFQRVAGAIAQSERLYGASDVCVHEIANQFHHLMADLRFMPNTPALANAGKPGAHRQFSACFVVPVQDDMRSIADAIKAAMLIHQTGGGTGFSFSRLRPKGDRVRSSGGVASGPVSFMRIFDSATEQVKQGSYRRGANMGILDVSHPDVLDFISCKAKDGEIRNFNISVAVTDTFMRAVEQDAAWQLINPRTGQAVKTIPARQIWDVLVRHAWANGEPGLFFIDRANADNPIAHLGRIEATNPCITADALVYTAQGLQRVEDLMASGQPVDAVVEGLTCCSPATPMFKTASQQPIFRLETEEGYSLRVTKNHKIMTDKGMIPAEKLMPGDKVKLLSQGGGFGHEGSRELGLVMGWTIGKGALLDFYYQKDQVAAMFQDIVDSTLPESQDTREARSANVLLLQRAKSERLVQILAKYGLTQESRLTVPAAVLTGSEDMQRAFLQAMFSVDDTAIRIFGSEIFVRLACISLSLLHDIQRLLLNFGVASRINTDPARSWSELVISKSNLAVFAKRIGLIESAKQRKLDDLAQYTEDPQESFWARFKALVPDGIEDVYCLTEPITHTFVANGLVIANCGEQMLHPWDACTLGHINLERHLVRDNKTDRMDLDWEQLAETVWSGVRFLDNVIDAADHPLAEINEMTRRTRRIGLGVMGLARTLFAKQVPYDSVAGLEETEAIMAKIKHLAWSASEALAAERGVYPAWTGSRHGAEGRKVRNSFLMTVAPTGSTAMICHTSSGIEPEFSLVWFKRVLDGKRIPYICEPFEQVARAEGWWRDDLLQQIEANHGSCRGVAGVPEHWQRVFATAHDIMPRWHVEMQAAVQRHVDTAVSKTINMPSSATVEDVSNAYMLAWRMGCKGITVYRDGSRKDQVLNVGTASSNGAPAAPATGTQTKPAVSRVEPPVPVTMPAVLDAKRVRVDSPDGTIYVHIGYVDGQPREVFAATSEDAKHEEVYEAFARTFSIALQWGVPLEKLLKQLDGANKKYGSVSTIPAAILRAFRIVEQTGPTDAACPKCSGVVVFQEGCLKCLSCGWSKCD